MDRRREWSPEAAIFGTSEAAAIRREVGIWCQLYLGSAVGEILFEVSRLGFVQGVVLEDGRRVVVKARLANEPVDRLSDVVRVQEALALAGFPCPAPVMPPKPLANGVAVAEEMLDAGDAPDAHRPVVRKVMAEGLGSMIAATRGVPVSKAFVRTRPPQVDYSAPGLWPPAGHPRLEFEATGARAEWIDNIAMRAKAVLMEVGTGATVIGHSDYEAHNVRCVGDRLAAVYDWDALIADGQEVIVGFASAIFTAHPDPRLPDAPTPAERDSFIEEYEHSVGHRFTKAERRTLDAASVWVTAFNARLHHAFAYGQVDGPGSFAHALRAMSHHVG